MQYNDIFTNKKSKIYSKRHNELINELEKLLEKGVPDLTMSEIASKLRISLGKHALDAVINIDSPIQKLEEYLFIVNQAVGPKFNSFFKDLEKVDGADEMVDYHENFISDFTKKLLDDAIQKKEIQNIDTKAFSILLGGIGREFLKEKNRDSINSSPEDSANSITSIILNGIKLKN